MVGPFGFDAGGFAADAGGISIALQHPSIGFPADACRILLEHVLDEEGVELRRLLVVLADHATVLDINRRFLDHDYHTDVLAFDYGAAEGAVEGEIYVDLDTARERHAEFAAGFREEVLRYAVHGLLHLIGYSDKTDSGEAEMQALEDRYLEAAS
jgi:rRNA maturation RNase YbeY